MQPDWADFAAGFDEPLVDWAHCWQTFGLGAGFNDRISIRFNSRFRRTLGRCQLLDARIELASILADAPRDLLLEVLCHESAHAAVYELHGATARPHGAEWRALMRAAGFEPRTRYPTEALPQALRERTRPRLPWSHHCPVCTTTRNTSRRRPDWRCTRCIRAGRSGRLVIERAD